MAAFRIVEKSQTISYPRGAHVLHLVLVLLFNFALLDSILAF